MKFRATRSAARESSCVRIKGGSMRRMVGNEMLADSVSVEEAPIFSIEDADALVRRLEEEYFR